MSDTAVHHQSMNLDGYSVFYRQAGPPNAPVLLLPHGYPCSSYQYRNFMPRLADRWLLIAPEYSVRARRPGGQGRVPAISARSSARHRR